ncbi:hypothetical protein ACWZEH_34525 (plasmid) [Streptomyces sp. QTS137]
MTTPSDDQAVPVPVRLLLPDDQEIVARLWRRRQLSDGWRYEVGIPAYTNTSNAFDRGRFPRVGDLRTNSTRREWCPVFIDQSKLDRWLVGACREEWASAS